MTTTIRKGERLRLDGPGGRVVRLARRQAPQRKGERRPIVDPVAREPIGTILRVDRNGYTQRVRVALELPSCWVIGREPDPDEPREDPDR